jgi:hypothetical protein
MICLDGEGGFLFKAENIMFLVPLLKEGPVFLCVALVRPMLLDVVCPPDCIPSLGDPRMFNIGFFLMLEPIIWPKLVLCALNWTRSRFPSEPLVVPPLEVFTALLVLLGEIKTLLSLPLDYRTWESVMRGPTVEISGKGLLCKC